MINISVTIDATRAKQLLNEGASQLPFALSKAVNATRNDAQAAVQQRLRTKFTIAPSRLQFMERLVKRTGNATKAKPVAEVGIVGPSGKGGRGRAEILSRHTEGGVRFKYDRNNPFFIPSDALRPGDFDVAPRALFPSALRLINTRGIDGGLTPLATNKGGQISTTKRVRIEGRKGRGSTEKRSFFVAPLGSNAFTPGIYERVRTGPDKGDLQLLWLYKSKINLGRPRLLFVPIVQREVGRRFQLNLERELRDAILSRFR